MFEKEAEEYAGNREVCDLLDAISEDLQNYDYGTVAHYNIDLLAEECFKDGAEFGYNKANEWHYVKDGDFPEEEKEYLIYTKKKKLEIRKIHISGDGKNYLTDVFLMRDLESVIAWKEIVLPKEIKEND